MYIAIALVLLLPVLLVIFISTRPAEFRMHRSIHIAAPRETVFPLVNNLRNWDAWSPWAKLDPDMRSTYDGPEAGIGASHAWKGNKQVGEGHMAISDSRPPERVQVQLEFIKPFPAKNTAEFTFDSQDNGTLVTWSMYGKNNFMAKAFQTFVDMDKMLGKDFEKGLAAMKAEAEAGSS